MKLTKTSAGYIGIAKNKLKSCKYCVHYYNYKCDLVMGKISPNAHCKYWKRG